MLVRILNALWLTLISAFLLVAGCTTGGRQSVIEPQKDYIANRCAETKPIRVAGREFIRDGDSYDKIKQQVINALLVDAVRQVAGIEIKNHFSSRISVTNNKLDEEVRSLNVEKARGYINKFSIAHEDVLHEGGTSLLSVVLDATVCVPANRFIREIVAIGDITSPEGKVMFDSARDLIATAYFENPRFDVTKADPKDAYHDWLLTGRLVNVSARIENSFLNLFRQAFTLSLSPVPNRPRIIDTRVAHVMITTYMQAENVFDKSILSDTTTLERDIPLTALNNGLDRMVDSLAEEAMVESTKQVFRKLLARPVD